MNMGLFGRGGGGAAMQVDTQLTSLPNINALLTIVCHSLASLKLHYCITVPNEPIDQLIHFLNNYTVPN